MDVEIRNNRKGPLKFKAGDQEFTIKPDFSIQYNSQLYLVKAGKSRWVPEEAITPQLGWPEAVNTPKHKRRDEEISRLRVLYGVYDDEEAWEYFREHFGIEVYDHDGERIRTPIDDPVGTNVRIVDETDEKVRLEAIVANLVNRIDQLEAQNAGPPSRPDEPDDETPVKLNQPAIVGQDGNDTEEVDDLDAHLDFQAPEDTPGFPPVDE